MSAPHPDDAATTQPATTAADAPADVPADVPAEAWSGVHCGPLRAGEWVQVADQKGRRHNFELTPGKRFFSHKGHHDHD